MRDGGAPPARARDGFPPRALARSTTRRSCSGPGHGTLATPVRYYHLDFAVMFSTAPGSPKMRNLATDPRVSAGIFAPLVGQASSRGAQLFGRARVLSEDDADFAHYWPAFRWQSDHVERSRSLDEPQSGPLVVIEAERIVYTEHWLRREGFSPRQFWTRTP
ncbi:pyridoxamine 5'-phosphate oxidase family protein [Streptomyces parvus]|uniref:pyridoxamine 5'-phosphate oxidase family protein n=1 Tax=Streptomyces parvus TaxID=66428 RepID=UPI00362C6390